MLDEDLPVNSGRSKSHIYHEVYVQEIAKLRKNGNLSRLGMEDLSDNSSMLLEEYIVL